MILISIVPATAMILPNLAARLVRCSVNPATE